MPIVFAFHNSKQCRVALAARHCLRLWSAFPVRLDRSNRKQWHTLDGDGTAKVALYK